MNDFATLLYRLEKASKEIDQRHALLRFFERNTDEEVCWALWLLKGSKPRKSLDKIRLIEWTLSTTATPQWLYEASLEATGNLAETCALLFRGTPQEQSPSLAEALLLLLGLPTSAPDLQQAKVIDFWKRLSPQGRFWFNRLLLGTFRFSLSTKILIDSLATYLQRETYTLWYRLLADWSPREITLTNYFSKPQPQDAWVRPAALVPIVSAELPLSTIASADHQAHWFWDGLRSQLIRRGNDWYLWSEQGEWLSGKFPEFSTWAKLLPADTVLEGFILGITEGRLVSGKPIRERAKKKKPTKKVMADCPAVFLLGTVLTWDGKEQSENPSDLTTLLATHAGSSLLQTEDLPFKNAKDLESYLQQARDQQAQGILLKSRIGEEPPLFFPSPPLQLNAVLLYVTRDDRKPGYFSELSFAVWKGSDLIPIVKCANTLTAEENQDLKTFVKDHAIEKFGPVTSISAELVFSISYTDVIPAARRKSGLELQQPLLLGWERDAGPEVAIELKELLDKLQH